MISDLLDVPGVDTRADNSSKAFLPISLKGCLIVVRLACAADGISSYQLPKYLQEL